jgi:hypothetical protein
MAAVSQSMVGLNEPTGTLTVTITFDSITLLVTSVTIVNGLGHSYTFTVTNTANPVQTITRTIGQGTTIPDLTGLVWPINADASLADGWTFQG